VVGSESSFEQGREQLQLLAGLDVTAQAVERQAEAVGNQIQAAAQQEPGRAKQLELPAVGTPAVPLLYSEMEGTGVPVVKAETVGREGTVAGQPAHTREAKLGCVFTQTTTDAQGHPMRDVDSTTYLAAIEGAEPFGVRGWSRAERKVVIGDGAVWIWKLAAQHFPGAIRLKHLDQGTVESLVQTLREISPATEELARSARNAIDYFTRNARRMRYPLFRTQGLFVGSGVVEAGCKTASAPGSNAPACLGACTQPTPS
jgi:hypothetical protein